MNRLPIIGTLLLLLFLVACASVTMPTATSTIAPSATNTPTPEPAVTPTNTPAPESTATPTNTPTPTPTPDPWGDPDGDGHPTYFEQAWGTDPLVYTVFDALDGCNTEDGEIDLNELLNQGSIDEVLARCPDYSTLEELNTALENDVAHQGIHVIEKVSHPFAIMPDDHEL